MNCFVYICLLYSNLGRMNEMCDCNLKFGVVALYYIGVIYLLIDSEMFVYIFVCCCALIPILSSNHVASSGFTKWK